MVPTPAHCHRAAAFVDEDGVAEKFGLGPDPDPDVQRIGEYVDAGFDHVYLDHFGSNLEGFFTFYAPVVSPSVP